MCRLTNNSPSRVPNRKKPPQCVLERILSVLCQLSSSATSVLRSLTDERVNKSLSHPMFMFSWSSEMNSETVLGALFRLRLGSVTELDPGLVDLVLAS